MVQLIDAADSSRQLRAHVGSSSMRLTRSLLVESVVFWHVAGMAKATAATKNVVVVLNSMMAGNSLARSFTDPMCVW